MNPPTQGQSAPSDPRFGQGQTPVWGVQNYNTGYTSIYPPLDGHESQAHIHPQFNARNEFEAASTRMRGLHRDEVNHASMEVDEGARDVLGYVLSTCHVTLSNVL